MCISDEYCILLPSTLIVSCQTILSFPMDVDLESMVGPLFFHIDSDDTEWANSSLRRKLFGKPQEDICTVDTDGHENVCVYVYTRMYVDVIMCTCVYTRYVLHTQFQIRFPKCHNYN